MSPVARLVAAFLLCLLGAAPVLAQPVREDAFVRIGGVEQWVTIRGQDSANPVVLFLHGGPGEALTPHADARFADWEQDFTLVQWDQRGTARSFGRSGARDLSVARLTADGIELAEYLARRLGKKKIVLVGHSFGTVPGIQMARARPDLFHAYVGLSQVTSLRAAGALGFAKLEAQARAAKDEKTLAALAALGAPDWQRLSQWQAWSRAKEPYEPRDAAARTDPAHDTDLERMNQAQGADYSTVILFGLTLGGTLMEMDLAAQDGTYALPVFLIAGERDLTAPPELARAWFDRLRAPRKSFTLVPGAGHTMSRAHLGALRTVLQKDIAPLARD